MQTLNFNISIKIILISALLFLSRADISAFSDNYIKELDTIRTSIIAQGDNMPDLIRQARDNDLRTLERIFELSTSALTTIEAYFKMLRIAIVGDGKVPSEVITSLNEWLAFINNHCKYDIEYLDEALAETENQAVIDHINTAKNNLQKLSEATERAIEENGPLLGQ